MHSFKSYLGYAGIPTFVRAEHTQEVAGADIVVVGNPFDNGTTNRTGARFGPRAIREQSIAAFCEETFYPWVYDVRERCKIVEYGDVVSEIVGAGATLAMAEELERESAKIFDAGASLLILGGDHTTPYGPMRAAAKKFGKLSVVQFDAHQDAFAGGHPNYMHHASFAWDLVDEGVIDDARSTQLYIRTLEPPENSRDYLIFYADDAIDVGPDQLAHHVRERVGDTPVYITFDVDALDPNSAPGTGTPAFGGPSVREVRRVLKGLAGINVVAADVVEVAPQLDAANQITALAGATIAIDLCYLMAEARNSHRRPTRGETVK